MSNVHLTKSKPQAFESIIWISFMSPKPPYDNFRQGTRFPIVQAVSTKDGDTWAMWRRCFLFDLGGLK